MEFMAIQFYFNYSQEQISQVSMGHSHFQHIGEHALQMKVAAYPLPAAESKAHGFC
jgi:hypothetical protein